MSGMNMQLPPHAMSPNRPSMRHAPRIGRTGRILSATAAALTVLLLLAGCGAEDPQERGMALLDTAARGDVSALDALLGGHADADYRDSCDWTPLMKAALNGHLPAVQRLLDAGADVDAADKGGYTGLMLAASNNHADVVRLLLEHGAMIDARESTQGYTALIWAAHRGHQETVSVLLEHGADPTLPDFEGKTADQHAVEQGHQSTHALLAGKAAASPARG